MPISLLIRFFWLCVLVSLHTASAAPLSRVQVLRALMQPGPIFGMHDTLGGPQAQGYAVVTQRTGRPPLLWSGDFGFSESKVDAVDDIAHREAQRQKMLALGEAGVLLTLSWHQCNPAGVSPCSFKEGVQTALSSEQWEALLDETSELHRAWLASLSPLVQTLASLQDHGVTVILRPLHEANIPGMWWANADPAKSIALYRALWQELTQRQHLHNLVWTWSAAYHPRYWARWQDYYPGADVVDVLGVDIYPPAADKAPDFVGVYRQMRAWAGPRAVLALSEVSRLPDPEALAATGFAYVVPWGLNMLDRDNPLSESVRAYRQRGP